MNLNRRWLIIGILSIVVIIVALNVISNYSKTAAQEEFFRLESIKAQAEWEAEQAELLTKQINESYTGLENAKTSLNDATAFHAFRSRSERDRDIRHAQELIKDYENSIRNLESQIIKYMPNYKSKL